MREVRIRPWVGAPPPYCGAPHPPWVVGLSQVIGGARSGRGVGAGAGLCAQEADAGQRAGGSGEGEGVAGPDGAAERGGGPQAAGTAEDGLVGQNDMREVKSEMLCMQPSQRLSTGL